MADYRLSASIISRSNGRSAVAAAAYRAGERILDERTGDVKDYTRKRGILQTLILNPQNVPDWIQTRARLWNNLEHREDKSTRRSTAQLAREIQLSLPHELTHAQRVELVCDFVRKEFVEHGVVADIAIHAPPRGGDDRNHHAHVLLPLRKIGPDGFGKKARLWEQQDSNAKRKSWQQFEKERLVEWRRLWSVYENRALARYGHPERVDHRRLKDQGIDREPTTHIGPDATEMERRGVSTDRGDQNRRIKAVNDDIALAKAELAESEQRLAELKRQLEAERMEQIQKTVRAADIVWENAERRQLPPALLQSQGPQPYSVYSTPPVAAGGTAASMPDDLSEHEKTAADREAARQQEEQQKEQVRQQKAAEDEQARQKQAADDHQKKLDEQRQANILAENKRVEEFAKQCAERQAAQADEMRKEYALQHSDMVRKAQFDAYNALMYRRAEEAREQERQAALERKAKEGPIRDAGLRYGQALGQNYDLRDPYGTLAKSAMAEYAGFMRDRQAYDRQIAQTADPIERQRLELRKQIEGADYLALTGDRIAKQSEIITGRLNSQEAVKERDKATDWRIKGQDLRQQLRELHRGPTQEKDPDLQKTESKPEPTKGTPPRSPSSDPTDERIRQQDELQKAKDRANAKAHDIFEEQERKRAKERGDSWER